MNLVEIHENNVHGSNLRLKEISQNPKAHSGSGPWTCHIGRITKNSAMRGWRAQFVLHGESHSHFCWTCSFSSSFRRSIANLLTWFSFFLQFELTDILPIGNSSNHPDEWYRQLKQRITMVNWAINNNELLVQKGDPTCDFQERERYG